MYMAPELISFGFSTTNKLEVDGCKCDIYSMAILFVNIANPTAKLFEGMRVSNILKAVASGELRPSLPEQLPLTIAELLPEMWSQDATQRPCTSHVVSVLCAA